MPTALASRLGKLEARLPNPRPHRVIQIVASNHDEAKALELAKAEGYDPERDDNLVILNLITGVSSSERAGPDQPQVFWRSAA